MTVPNEVLQLRRMSGMTSLHGWVPLTVAYAVKPDEMAVDEWFPPGSAREFDLKRGNSVVGVRTSAESVMLAGRKVAVGAVVGIPSRPCKRERAA